MRERLLEPRDAIAHAAAIDFEPLLAGTAPADAAAEPREALVLLREPTRHNAGYVWTFAKGRPEAGETPRATALREVREETGYAARIIAPIPGTFAGTVGRSAFWLMDATHPPAPFDGETVRIHWATFDEARSLIELTETPAGRARDHAILTATELVLQGLPHDQRLDG